MPRGHSVSRRYLIFLALLCAILAVVLVVELTTGNGTEDVATIPPAKPQSQNTEQNAEREAEAPSGFVMPPEDTYAEVSERPLFLRSRRPLPPELEARPQTPTATSRAAFILSGVVLTGTQRMALIQTQSSPKIARVEEGQEYEGWTVEAIHPNRVVMRRGQDVSEIVLEDRVRKAPPRDRRRVRKRVPPNQPPENGDDEQEERED